MARTARRNLSSVFFAGSALFCALLPRVVARNSVQTELAPSALEMARWRWSRVTSPGALGAGIAKATRHHAARTHRLEKDDVPDSVTAAHRQIDALHQRRNHHRKTRSTARPLPLRDRRRRSRRIGHRSRPPPRPRSRIKRQSGTRGSGARHRRAAGRGPDRAATTHRVRRPAALRIPVMAPSLPEIQAV